MILKKKIVSQTRFNMLWELRIILMNHGPKKKKLQNMFWKRHVAMHKTGMSFVVIKRYRELLQLMWLRT